MSDCLNVDPLITPYVDGDIGAAERRLVDEHLRACPPCHSRVAAEQAVRGLLHMRRASLSSESASATLRDRCAALRATSSPGSLLRGASTWRARLVPFSVAATLVLVVAGAFLYVWTDRSTRVLAAELTADHVKCFGVINTLLGTSPDRLAIESAMASTFGWPLHMPDVQGASGFELVGARPCLYAKGKMAHLMYRHNGHPMSVFMIPNMTRPDVPGVKNEIVDVMGHEAAVWSTGGRTFVLVARESQYDVAQAVAFVQKELK
jgi:anti-sigma factor RsiW